MAQWPPWDGAALPALLSWGVAEEEGIMAGRARVPTGSRLCTNHGHQAPFCLEVKADISKVECNLCLVLDQTQEQTCGMEDENPERK